MITPKDVLAQFDKIDKSELPRSIVDLIPAIREAMQIRMEEFQNNGKSADAPEAGRKFGFKSRYINLGESEEEAVSAELSEELIDSLNYLMMFKHMYSSIPGTDIPSVNRIVKTLEELLVSALVSSLMLGVEASRLALLEQEELERSTKEPRSAP